MKFFANLIPAEIHYGKKGTLHEECENTLNSKRGAKNIPYKPRIVAPIGAELKFEDNTGCNSDSKINGKNCTPETGHASPEESFSRELRTIMFCKTIILCLHESNDEPQTKCKRHKNPVKHSSQRKLHSGRIYQASKYHNLKV